MSLDNNSKTILSITWLVVWSIFWTTRVDHLNSDLHCQVASRNQHVLGHLAAVKQTDPSYLVQRVTVGRIPRKTW
jgi:hypothetical protein